MNLATSKAAAVAAWEENQGRSIDDLTERRIPGGISIWTLGASVCVTESLSDDAPARYIEIIRQRVLANLSGRCPECTAVAGVAAQGRGAMRHADHCPVGRPPAALAAYLDPAGTAHLLAVTTTSR
ncbi:hypothetical protein ACTU6V_12730 [Microbacterium sp. A204]|uniref:hypothetical protein n=1 Tax=Microbacterium sp. A204 TaxID=3457321 RepID=UPI003FD18C5D